MQEEIDQALWDYADVEGEVNASRTTIAELKRLAAERIENAYKLQMCAF